MWPFGVARQGETSNHLMLRWLATVVVSDEEKAQEMRQVGIGCRRRALAVSPVRRAEANRYVSRRMRQLLTSIL